ncbi:glycosyltransferase [Micromonospora sp. URMC 105]|uniref:glycosyltransferase n=1 Tax=Micromonospora sp. URMC 105 TaxID=3423413 RepID=UPI003F1C5B53
MTTNALPHHGLPTPTALAGKSVALVHEWFSATGGSEQVYLRMAEVVPHARRFVLWKEHDVVEDGEGMQESWMSRTPLRRSKALALPFMPLAWRTLTRENFEVVVSSSHAFAHTVKLGSAETKHFAYVHSPARYVWSPDLDGRGSSTALAFARKALQAGDTRLSRHVDSYAANSREVRDRIHRFWGRDSRIIHPPVEVGFYAAAPAEVRSQERRYLLGVGRWITYKRFDLMIEVAAEANLPLIIAGSGPEEQNLRRLAEKSPASVTFEVRPSNDRLRELYWGAVALLYPTHEDFGIVPVEAQVCGTPVVGLARGGLLDTVVDGSTGFLIDSLDARRLAAAVEHVGQLDVGDIRANADRFSTAAFQANISDWLSECQ